jgi:O-antigen ligase
VSYFDAPRHGSVQKNINAAIFWSFLAAIALAPLPFGLVEPAYQSLWAVALGAILFASQLFQGERARHSISLLLLMVAAAVLASVFAFQLGTFRFWGSVESHSNSQTTWLSLGTSLAASGNLLLLFLTIACGLSLGQNPERGERLAIVVGWSALVYGAVGLYQASFAPNELLWALRPGYKGLVLGTFVNRNTSAAYFGVALIVWSLLALRILVHNLRDGEGVPLTNKKYWFCILAAIFMGLCMIKTGSRAGTVLSFGGLAFGALVYVSVQTDRSKKVVFRYVALGPILLAIFAVIGLAGTQLSDRLSEHSFTDNSRTAVASASKQMADGHFWMGAGPGSFPWLFPPSRPDTLPIMSVWDHAHNTYLEVAIEYGVPATIALIVVTVLLFLVLLLKALGPGHHHRLLPVAAASCMVVAALHALVDFPLLVPGYSLPLAALVSVALAARQGAPRRSASVKKRAHSVERPGDMVSSRFVHKFRSGNSKD